MNCELWKITLTGKQRFYLVPGVSVLAAAGSGVQQSCHEHSVSHTFFFFLLSCLPSTPGRAEDGGRDQEDPWHLSGDVRLDIKTTRNDGVGVTNCSLSKYCVQSKPYQKPFPVLTCSTVKRVTGAATWHQIPLLEHQSCRAESCAGDESGAGLRTLRVNDGGSAARPGPSALPLSLQCPPVPLPVSCHLSFPLSLWVLYSVSGRDSLFTSTQERRYSPGRVRGDRSL